MGDGVSDGAGEGVPVGVGDGVSDGAGEGVSVAAGDGVSDAVGVADGDGVYVGTTLHCQTKP